MEINVRFLKRAVIATGVAYAAVIAARLFAVADAGQVITRIVPARPTPDDYDAVHRSARHITQEAARQREP